LIKCLNSSLFEIKCNILKGDGIRLHAVLLFLILSFFIFFLFGHIFHVLAASIDSVNLVSPENNACTSQDNDSINFTFNYSGNSENSSCILYITNSTNDFVAVGYYPYISNGLNIDFKSNTSITEGTRQWYVNCTNSTTVQSDVRTLNVSRLLKAKIVKPIGTQGFLAQYPYYDIINISGYVEDGCGQGVEGAHLGPSSPAQRYIIQGFFGSPIRYCSDDWKEGGGWYNCSWPSYGNRIKYNIIMNVSKNGYTPNSTIELNAFNLGTAPVINNPTVFPSSEGWGYSFTFNAYFADADMDINNISLWKSFDNQTWERIDSRMKSSSGVIVSFHERFTCADSTPISGKINYYKLNVTDPYNYTSETGSGSFSLNENNISLIKSPASSNSASMLIENATLEFRMYDEDGQTYPTGIEGLIWIGTDGENYTKVMNCTTNNGYCQIHYDPRALTLQYGTQYWKAGVINTCYENENSTVWNLEVTPIRTGNIYPRISVNGSNVSISLSASNYEALWADVVMPNSTVVRLTLSNNVPTTFNQTNLIGRYNVTFYANNSLGEVVNGSDYFETSLPVLFNVSVVDQNSSGVNSSIIFYYRNENISMNDSNSGNYSTPIADSIWDMEIKTHANKLQVLLKGINVSSENNKTFGVDKYAEGDYLVTYGISNHYNISNATVMIFYDDTSYSDENNLHLYKCNQYNFSSRVCLGLREDVTGNSMHDTTSHYFITNVTSFSGFSIKQYLSAGTPVSGGDNANNGIMGLCYENWSCEEWKSCQPINIQSRICVDMGTCKRGEKTETRYCSYLPTCYDGTSNGNETDIDCGGSCPPCINGNICLHDGDCQSRFCDRGMCKALEDVEKSDKIQGYGDNNTWILYIGLLFVFTILLFTLVKSGLYQKLFKNK